MRKLGAIVGIVGLVGVLGATETRVWTLAQGGVAYLTDDELIVQFFPAEMFKFGNFFTVENPIVPGGSIAGFYRYGSAFYTGDNFGFGLYLGRSRNILMFIDTIAVAPLDFVIGGRSGANAFALNLTLDKSSSRDDARNLKKSALVFSFRPGFTLDLGGGSAFDGALFLDYDKGVLTDTLDNLAEKSSTFGVGFHTRFVGSIIFPFEILFYKTSDTISGIASAKVSSFFIAGGPGTQLKFDMGSILVNGTVYFENITASDSTSHKELGIATRLGGEFHIWKGLLIRGSVRYDLLKFVSSSMSTPEKYFTLGDFGPFTFGAGYDFGFARVDVGLSTDLFTNGPYFLTGNAGSAMITMLSILGKF